MCDDIEATPRGAVVEGRGVHAAGQRRGLGPRDRAERAGRGRAGSVRATAPAAAAVRHEHVPEPVPERSAPIVAPVPRQVHAILALQRSAGNAAVTRMLARQDDSWEDWGGGTATAADLSRRHPRRQIRQRHLQGRRHRLRGRRARRRAAKARPADRHRHDTRRPGPRPTASTPRRAATPAASPSPASRRGSRCSRTTCRARRRRRRSRASRRRPTWADEDKVAQRLLRIFLTRWTEGAQGFVPPSAAELIEHAGAYESNEATNEYGVGVKDAADWCAQASSSALAEAMLKSGLRFNKPPVEMSFRSRVTASTARPRSTTRPGSTTSGSRARARSSAA